ncbi:hypothetical protein F5Y19DRAFT_466466 [Xylariaceae sp. FL1651]|nr:hypothetical protein F5Y19DRAFT_466466 [Xylariaceae sp. FL1651]
MKCSRGLRWTISSTSLRNAYLRPSCRSFTSSPVVCRKSQDICSSVTAVMAKLPHPAVIITTLDRTYHAQAAAGIPIEQMQHPIARGITVSSFTSLCIKPKPHVLFNMTLPSTMYEALVSCKDFNVHLLTPDEVGAQIANVFTRGNRLPSQSFEEQSSGSKLDNDADLGVFRGLKVDRFRHIDISNREAWHRQYQEAKRDGLEGSESTHGLEARPNSTSQDSGAAAPAKQVHQVPHLQGEGVIEVMRCRLVRTIHPNLPDAGQNVIIIGEVVDVESIKKFDTTPVALGYANRIYRAAGNTINLHE